MRKSTITLLSQISPTVSRYDPLRIQFAQEYYFLSNIYSPLVEYSLDGQLVSAIAESFKWVGHEAHFQIRQNLRTIDGHKIDAFDVESTFKRILIMGGNSHGDLQDMICPGIRLKSLQDTCPTMQVGEHGHSLIIRFKEPMPFFFPMLAGMDFAIIPKRSIDPKTLRITDYRNTSGPYYVHKNNKKGLIELKTNPASFHYSKKIPQRVLIRPWINKGDIEILPMLTTKKADMVITHDKPAQHLKLIYAETHKEFRSYSTLPIQLFAVAFTNRGIKRLAESDRIGIGKTLKRIFLKNCSGWPIYKPSNQLFPILAEGSLPKEKTFNIEKKWSPVRDDVVITRRLVAWSFISKQYLDEDSQEIKKLFPETTFIRGVKGLPGLINYKKMGLNEPDFYIFRTDMGFLEDIGLLSYFLNTDFFCVRGKAAAQWMHNYVRIQNKSERLPLLRELHYNTLDKVSAIPFAFSPYVALVRKPWVFDMSKLEAGTPLWRIHQE